MILYLWYLLGTFSVRAENDSHDGEKKSLLELVYPLDYRQHLKLDFTDSAKVKRKNREWLKEVEKNEKMKNFIIDMATINDTITVTPLTGLNMDGTSTPICFFAYDSSFEPIHEEVYELANAMSVYFHERVGIMLLDFAYPSNYEVFKPLYTRDPMIYVRPGMNYYVMFDHENTHAKNPGAELKIKPVSQWGLTISYRDLLQEPLASFKKIDSVWEKLSDGHKILARYNLRANRDDHEMAMQKRTWKLYEGREIYSRLFHEIYESLQMNAINKTLAIEDPKTSDYIAFHRFVDKVVAESDFATLLEQEFVKRLKEQIENAHKKNKNAKKDSEKVDIAKLEEMYSQSLHPAPELIPTKRKALKPLIPKWNQLKHRDL